MEQVEPTRTWDLLLLVLRDNLRLLLFRPTSPAMAQHWRWFLGYGLLVTWLAGIGRYWDHPRAEIWQHLGLGSLAYVLVLAAVLWLIILPLAPRRWSYRNVLIFLTLCSPPALLYAIPVERFMTLNAAQATNACFLAIVASWRVALLIVFLRGVAGLSLGLVIVGSLLPLTAIVVSLAALNLEHVVFSIMAGIAPGQRSASDLSYTIVWMISLLSILALPILLIGYVAAIVSVRRRLRT